MSSSVSSSDSDDRAFEESFSVSYEAEDWQYSDYSDTCSFCTKEELLQEWEDSDTCCFCSKSQILRGKEKLPPSPNFSNNKPGRAVKPINLENKANNGNMITSTAFVSNDWSPMDDSIPSTSSEKTSSIEDVVNTHIDRILHGPFLRKRLPVFTEFCPK